MTKLLTIDDETQFTEFIKGYFELRGYDVCTANDGETGLEVAQKEKPDVILIDLKMPGMNGDEVMLRMKEISPSTNVIMITASGGLGKIRGGLKELGAFACFDKPLSSLKDLEAKVKEAVQSR